MCDWICNNLLDDYRRQHPRWIRAELWAKTQLDKTLPRVCLIGGTIDPLLRPSEFGQCYSGPSDQDYLNRHLIRDIEDALAGRCDHQPPEPNILIALTLIDGDSVLFYPCEAVKLLGREKAQKILTDLLTEARQSLVNEPGDAWLKEYLACLPKGSEIVLLEPSDLLQPKG